MTPAPRLGRRCLVALLLASGAGCGGGGGGLDLGALPPPVPDGQAVALGGRWVASRNLEITVYEGTKPVRTLTTGHDDFKPVWSPSGDTIAFFRAISDAGDFYQWRTKLCVIHADGTGYRELTDGSHRDFNPTWTRDGTGRILFNRYAEGGDPSRNDAYWTTPDASPGDEVQLNHGAGWEWVDAGLLDGRLFVDRYNPVSGYQSSYLLTPGDGGGYRELARPTHRYWHKVSVSPSQTRVAYMLDLSGTPGIYSDDVLYWAELDLESGAVTNPVLITRPEGGACINEYPRWYPDETMIVFDSSCAGDGWPRAYAYRLADGALFPISDDPGVNVMFVNYEHTPQ